MIRTAFLLITFIPTHHWLWDSVALKDGTWLVWAGTVHRFDMGAFFAFEWDHGGPGAYVAWPHERDDNGLCHAWTWTGARTLIDAKRR